MFAQKIEDKVAKFNFYLNRAFDQVDRLLSDLEALGLDVYNDELKITDQSAKNTANCVARAFSVLSEARELSLPTSNAPWAQKVEVVA